MPNGFQATKDKSKTKKEDLIKKIKGNSTVTNKELAELMLLLIEKLDK